MTARCRCSSPTSTAASSGRSKQMGMDKVGTLRWDGAVAQARMDNLLSAFYGKDKVHAVLSPYDGLSIGILSSLKGVGYCTARATLPVRERPGRGSPVGQVDHARASSTRRSSRIRANWPRLRSRWSTRHLGQASRKSTTPRPTTTGQGRSVLPAQAGRLTRPTGEDPGRQRLLQGDQLK
jgi:hypothetical protein